MTTPRGRSLSPALLAAEFEGLERRGFAEQERLEQVREVEGEGQRQPLWCPRNRPTAPWAGTRRTGAGLWAHPVRGSIASTGSIMETSPAFSRLALLPCSILGDSAPSSEPRRLLGGGRSPLEGVSSLENLLGAEA